MPSKRVQKSSSSLKQVKLQDMFAPKSGNATVPRHAQVSTDTQASFSKSVSNRNTVTNHSRSSSEEPSAVRMAPKRKPVVLEISSDSSDEGTFQPSAHVSKKRRILLDADSEESPGPSGVPIVASSPIQQTKNDPIPSDEELKDDNVSTTRPRRIHRRLSFDEDRENTNTEDLVDELDSQCILQSRLRSRGKLTKFQQSLAKLKKQKAKGHGRNTDDDNSEASVTPFLGSKPSENYQDEEDSDGDESSTDFIVEDSNTFELPLQFSRESHADLSHQFKKVFQLFVHVAVQHPARRAKFMKQQLEGEDYFAVPLITIRRKLSSLKDSLVLSSVWKPDFQKSLEIHPDLDLVRLEFAVPFCDACHLGGRMSTLLGRLKGQPYNQYGFENLKSKYDDGDGEEKKEFHLGRFCARRTKVYHQFMHWERALFDVIAEELEDLRGNSAGKIFHRVAFVGGKEPPTDLTDADELCEWLDQRKIIDMEWHKIEEMMQSARHLEVADGRDKED